MDRVIEKKHGPWRRWWPLGLAVLALLGLAFAVYDRSGVSRLSVDPARLTVAIVGIGQFREYFPFDGTVVPETSVYLDLEEGGRVDAILSEGGQWVEAGTPILKISNTSLQRTTIDTETQLLAELDQISNTQIKLAQDRLSLRDQLLDREFRIQELQRTFDRYEQLARSEVNPLTREEYERVRDELDYQKSKRDLLVERMEQEEILAQRQLERAADSVERLNTSLDLLSRLVESLEVRAPISGHLSSIDAQLGQNIARGARIGQIDLLDAFKIRVRVDQYYVSRINVGTPGRFRLDGQEHEVVVSKIYPEVVNNAFEVDVAFSGSTPANIRRGQTLTVELDFGETSDVLMVRKGGFFQQTAGRWAYLIAEDGRTARRVDIRLGRQNPQFVEVLEGLRAGDRIVTSGYDAFNGVDLLEFTEAL